jgi:ubiquinone/menaquinone biosynthesis C-methylase UbiE
MSKPNEQEGKSMKRLPPKHAPIFDDEDFAEEYARRHQKMAAGLGREYARKLQARGFQRGRILDLGCGFGATNMVLAQAFPEAEVVGIDLSDPLLRLARQRAKAAGFSARVKFEKADVHQIPYEDDSFEAIINANMVHLVAEPVRMLDEIERVLSPTGHLFIIDLRRSWLGIVEKEVRSALTLPEAQALVKSSRLRNGVFSSDLLWWRFEA